MILHNMMYIVSDNMQLCTVCAVCRHYGMDKQHTQVGKYVLCICTEYVCMYVIDLCDNGEKIEIDIIITIIMIIM